MKQTVIELKLLPCDRTHEEAEKQAIWVDATLPEVSFYQCLEQWASCDAIEDIDYIIESHKGFGCLPVSPCESLDIVYDKAQFIVKFGHEVTRELYAQFNGNFAAMKTYAEDNYLGCFDDYRDVGWAYANDHPEGLILIEAYVDYECFGFRLQSTKKVRIVETADGRLQSFKQ